VIPVADAVAFFAANRDEPVAIRVALEAFGGLRYSTAGRIGWENIKFAERGIEMPGALHKSGKRKFRQGHPENLWAWLELAKDKDHPVWAMTFRQYRFAKRQARMRAKVETPHNVWRHSFASYLLAKTKSLPTVGYLMQHRHTSTTEIYEGVANEADAAIYFGIVP
jgi:site-specific recombinase XerC